MFLAYGHQKATRVLRVTLAVPYSLKAFAVVFMLAHEQYRLKNMIIATLKDGVTCFNAQKSFVPSNFL